MLVGQYMYRTKQGYIYRTYINRTHSVQGLDYVQDKRRGITLWTTHFEQGQGQDIKQFGVGRGQGKWPKLRIWKLTTHMTMGHGLIGDSSVRLWDISLILSKYQILKRT